MVVDLLTPASGSYGRDVQHIPVKSSVPDAEDAQEVTEVMMFPYGLMTVLESHYLDDCEDTCLSAGRISLRWSAAVCWVTCSRMLVFRFAVFVNEAGALCQPHPRGWPLATCEPRATRMWLVQMEMHCLHEVHIRFPRLGTQTRL